MRTKIFIKISGWKDEKEALSGRRCYSAPRAEKQRGIQRPELILLAFWGGTRPTSCCLVATGDPGHPWFTRRLKHSPFY